MIRQAKATPQSQQDLKVFTFKSDGIGRLLRPSSGSNHSRVVVLSNHAEEGKGPPGLQKLVTPVSAGEAESNITPIVLDKTLEK